MTIETWGAFCFGLVVGWVTYRTLRRTDEAVGISTISGVIGAVGGGVITGISQTPEMFGWYSVGLAAGFFLYLLLGHTLFRKSDWLGAGN